MSLTSKWYEVFTDKKSSIFINNLLVFGPIGLFFPMPPHICSYLDATSAVTMCIQLYSHWQSSVDQAHVISDSDDSDDSDDGNKVEV